MTKRKQPPAEPKFFQTDEFRKLQREWDKKLADSGFNDIEPLNDNGSRETPYLKDHSIRFYKRYNASREDYYRLAGQFAEDTTSPIAVALPPTTRQLWRMHADGISLKEIRKALFPRKPYWAMKKLLQDTRQLFRAWCEQEAWRDRQDRVHEDEGGLDAWIDSMAQAEGGLDAWLDSMAQAADTEE